MTRARNRLDPAEAEKVKQAAAVAKEDILSQSAMDALLNATPDQLISASPDPEVIKGTMNRPECWIQGPGMVEFNAASDKRLTRVANWAGINVKKAERLHAELLAGTKLVIITAAQSTDLSGIPVNRYGSTAMFNLVDLLAEHDLKVESGYRERYEVAYVPKASQLWPGLVIDLSQRKERRLTSSKKSEAEGTTETAAAAKKSAGSSKKKSDAAPAQQAPAPKNEQPA